MRTASIFVAVIVSSIVKVAFTIAVANTVKLSFDWHLVADQQHPL